MANSTYTLPQYSFFTVAPGIAVTGGPLVVFTVTVGRVLVRSIVGTVSTIIGAGATTVKLSANVAGTDSDLCTASGALATKIVGTTVSVQGPVATALLISTGEGAVPAMSAPQVIRPCTIDAVIVGGTTGAIDWICEWTPLDPGALLA